MVGVLALSGIGCTSAFDAHRNELIAYHAQGRYDLAQLALAGKDVENLYGKQNRTLLQLERGAVALANDDFDATIASLEEAEQLIELVREKSATETVGQWLVNDRVAQYIAEPYEDLYVNVLKLLAQLERGRLAGGASVEARRLGRKGQLLRNEYTELKETLLDESDNRVSSSLESTTGEGEFIESPLGTYLAALTFLELNEINNFDVSVRRLQSTMEFQQTLQPMVRPGAFSNLGSMSAEGNDLLVVALSGRGPLKVAEKHGPYVIGSTPIYFELPRIQTNPSQVSSVEVEIALSGGGGDGGRLLLIEDFGAIAAENHRRQLPLIHARTYARALTKSAAVTVGSEIVGSDEDDPAAQVASLLVTIVGSLLIQATEQADLRAWSMLPGQAHVGVFDVPEGTHRVRVVYRGGGGSEIQSTPWQDVTVSDRGLQSLVTHTWR